MRARKGAAAGSLVFLVREFYEFEGYPRADRASEDEAADRTSRRGVGSASVGRRWHARQDSNLRPSDLEIRGEAGNSKGLREDASGNASTESREGGDPGVVERLADLLAALPPGERRAVVDHIKALARRRAAILALTEE